MCPILGNYRLNNVSNGFVNISLLIWDNDFNMKRQHKISLFFINSLNVCKLCIVWSSLSLAAEQNSTTNLLEIRIILVINEGFRKNLKKIKVKKGFCIISLKKHSKTNLCTFIEHEEVHPALLKNIIVSKHENIKILNMYWKLCENITNIWSSTT